MNINEYQKFPWKSNPRQVPLYNPIIKIWSLLKPITVKPAIYVFLLVGIFSIYGVQFLIIAYMLPIKSDQSGRFLDRDFNAYLKYRESIYSSRKNLYEYKTIRELLDDVGDHQKLRNYWHIIDILQHGRIDDLVAAELASPDPRFIFIGEDGPNAYGIEDVKDLWRKYKFLHFPGTSDAISDPGYDFWIMWAIDFTRRYNVKLMSELNKAKE